MNTAVVVGILVLVLVAGVAVFGAGGFVTSTTSTSSEGVAVTPPPADGSYGVVVGNYQSKNGFSVFGWDFTPSKWEAQVMFVPPAGCPEPEDVDLTVVAEGPCATVPAEGRLSGGGTDEDGNRLWSVSFEVSKACHDALEFNDAWPTTKPECAAN